MLNADVLSAISSCAESTGRRNSHMSVWSVRLHVMLTKPTKRLFELICFCETVSFDNCIVDYVVEQCQTERRSTSCMGIFLLTPTVLRSCSTMTESTKTY